MADIQVKIPWGNPLSPTLVTLKDMGDGTFAPVVSGAVRINGSSSTQGGGKKGGQVNATDAGADHGKVAIVTAGSSGTSGQILQSDGTYTLWASHVAANVATDGTVAQVVTALINAGLMASA